MSLTEKIIEKVKQHPVLYDLSHEDYKNCRKKDKVWDIIALELNEDGDLLKKKWKNIRDCYAKHLRSVKFRGQNNTNNYKKWQWAKQMDHFKPYLKIASTYASEQPPDDSAVHSESENENSTESNKEPDAVEHTETEITHFMETFAPTQRRKLETPRLSVRPKKNRNRYSDDTSDSLSITEAIDAYFQNKNQNKTVNVDPRNMNSIDLIFQGYANLIKQFSPKRQAMTKLKLAQLMTEQELEDQEEKMYRHSERIFTD